MKKCTVCTPYKMLITVRYALIYVYILENGQLSRQDPPVISECEHVNHRYCSYNFLWFVMLSRLRS